MDLTRPLRRLAANFLADADDEQHKRIASLRRESRILRTRLDEHLASGDWRRLLVPTVRDALAGLALGSGLSARPPSAIPDLGASVRPNLCGEANVEGISWPPEPGDYSQEGRTRKLGALGRLFLALTFEEVRIALQALLQQNPPASDAKGQLYRALHALSRTITLQSFSLPRWLDLWARLFGGLSGTVHTDSDLPTLTSGGFVPADLKSTVVVAVVQARVGQGGGAPTQAWSALIKGTFFRNGLAVLQVGDGTSSSVESTAGLASLKACFVVDMGQAPSEITVRVTGKEGTDIDWMWTAPAPLAL